MGALSFFADSVDAEVLVDWFNADPNLAYIVPDGPLDPEVVEANRLLGSVDNSYRQRWKAKRTVPSLKDGRHSLWHIPAGPLPLLTEQGPDSTIAEPWAGWTERRPGSDRTTPWFGPGHHAEIRLELWTRHRPYSAEERKSLPIVHSSWTGGEDLLLASGFQWIGGHYAPPPSETQAWWRRLKAWFQRSAAGLKVRRQVTFWAFPSAFAKLKGGIAYQARGYDLSAAIHEAELKVRCPELRDVLSTTIVLDPAWLTWNDGKLGKMARSIYDNNAFERMPILADALEEAGCSQAPILNHLRRPWPHSRDCWVFRLLLQ